MKKLEFKYELPKDIKLNEEEKDMTAPELAGNVIKNVMLTYGAAQRGMREDDRRLYYKICDKLDLKQEVVEFEDTEFGFIKKCFRESGLMPNSLLRKIEELIEAIPSR
jgi:hypothetical protein